MTPALAALIDELAERLVHDYLTPKSASDNDIDSERTEPAPLHQVDRAA
jgi:hypothetical protein